MRVRLVLCVAATLLTTRCAHRYPVRSGGDREAVEGIAVTFESSAEPLPKDTRVRWDFGDGSSAEGIVATHAFARTGEYRIRLDVTDPSGVRSDQAIVRVARRSPVCAVPPTAKAAVAFERFFDRLPAHLAILERLAGAERVAELREHLTSILGFDAAEREQVRAAGIDPDKGVAIAMLPGDEGMWIAIGVDNAEKALETMHDALTRYGDATFSDGPDGSTWATLGSTRNLFFVDRGYLYLYDPKDPNYEPKLDVIRGAPPAGLVSNPVFARGRAAVDGEDAVVYIQGDALPKHEAVPGIATKLHDATQAIVATFSVSGSEMQLQARALFKPEGEASLARLFQGAPKIGLEADAPEDTTAFLSVSVAPGELARWLEGLQESDGHEVIQDLGLGLKDLAGLLSGGFAIYGTSSILRGLMGQNNGAPPQILLTVPLRDPQTVRAKLGEAVATGILRTDDGGRWQASSGTAKGRIELAGDTMRVGDLALLDHARSKEAGKKRSLADRLRDALPNGALDAGHQVLYIDLATLVESLEKPKPTARQTKKRPASEAAQDEAPDLRALQPFRDAFVEIFPDGAMLALRARLRLR